MLPLTFDLESLPDVTGRGLGDLATEVMHKFCRVAEIAAQRAITEDSVDVLTEEEKIAICIASGCEIHAKTEEDTGKVTYATKNPVGFAIVNGKIQVFESKPLEHAETDRGELKVTIKQENHD